MQGIAHLSIWRHWRMGQHQDGWLKRGLGETTLGTDELLFGVFHCSGCLVGFEDRRSGIHLELRLQEASRYESGTT